MASSTTSASPALTSSPTAAVTRSTVPGIGAVSEPAARVLPGTGKRGSSTSALCPSAEST